MVDEEIFLQYILKILYYFKHDKTDMHYCGLVQYIFCRIWREWIFGGGDGGILQNCKHRFSPY